ncbi:hypothetical protein MP228_010245 [Amoeboaphelidium protococcarum]|nr:hypothetical protein MP228_010245 [Amoeboaphelidium protococcarum]
MIKFNRNIEQKNKEINTRVKDRQGRVDRESHLDTISNDRVNVRSSADSNHVNNEPSGARRTQQRPLAFADMSIDQKRLYKRRERGFTMFIVGMTFSLGAGISLILKNRMPQSEQESLRRRPHSSTDQLEDSPLIKQIFNSEDLDKK